MFNASQARKPATLNRSETLNMIMAILAVVVLGIGTATAAINVAPVNARNPALRPLTIGGGIRVQQAFGPDDEDCVWATHKVLMPDGNFRLKRKLECAQ